MNQTEITNNNVSNTSWMKIGFFSGIGSGLAMMIFVFVGLLFLIPGLIIVMKQLKKPKNERSTGWLVFGFILMGLGVIVGLGVGVSLFGTLIVESLSE